MKLLGVSARPHITGLEPLAGRSHYYSGDDPTKWRTNIPRYAKVKYESIYPGIDLVFYGNHGELEYDFVIAPGGDPAAIQLEFAGAEGLTVDADGHLILHAAGGTLVQRAPAIYQEIGGVKRNVSGRYRLDGPHQVAFEIGGYDVTRPLVIDPVLSYATYVGGLNSEYFPCIGAGLRCPHKEHANDIGVGRAGHTYIVGSTDSLRIPGGPITIARHENTDVFVAKLRPDGSDVEWVAYLWGGNDDFGVGLAVVETVDVEGGRKHRDNIYITGQTKSHITVGAFPTTPNAFAETGGGFNFDAFVTKLTETGQLEFSTYFGGEAEDLGVAIDVDGSGNIYVAVHTRSRSCHHEPPAPPCQHLHMPVINALAGQRDLPSGQYGAYVAAFNPDVSCLLYGTYLAGGNADQPYGLAFSSMPSGPWVVGKTRSAFSVRFPPPGVDPSQKFPAISGFPKEHKYPISLYFTG